MDADVTKTMAQSKENESASTTVFAIPELLEAILLNLPVQQLLVTAQRVDKTWQATIKDSVKLQQVLFFKSVPWTAMYSSLQPGANGAPIGKCELVKAMHEEYGDCNMARSMDRAGIALNPLMNRMLPEDLFFRKRFQKRFRALSEPNASWRRMFLSQPPFDIEISTAGKSISKLCDIDLNVLLNWKMKGSLATGNEHVLGEILHGRLIEWYPGFSSGAVVAVMKMDASRSGRVG